MKWTKGDKELEPSDRVSMQLQPKHVVLTVKNVDKADEGPYKLAMQNDFGKDNAEIKTEVKGKYKL